MRRPRYALLTGSARPHVLLRGVLRQRRDRALLPRARPSSRWTWLAILAAAWSWLPSRGDPRPRVARRPTSEPARGRGRRCPQSPRDRSRTAGTRPRIAIALGSPSRSCVPTALAVCRPSRPRSIGAATRPRARWVDRRARPHRARTRSSSAGGVTRRRYGTHSTSRVGGRTSTIIDDRTRLDEDLGDLTDVIDANLPTPPRLRDPGRPARDRRARGALRPRAARRRRRRPV